MNFLASVIIGSIFSLAFIFAFWMIFRASDKDEGDQKLSVSSSTPKKALGLLSVVIAVFLASFHWFKGDQIVEAAEKLWAYSWLPLAGLFVAGVLLFKRMQAGWWLFMPSIVTLLFLNFYTFASTENLVGTWPIVENAALLTLIFFSVGYTIFLATAHPRKKKY